MASEEMSFENVDGRTTDGRTTDTFIYYKLTNEPSAQVSQKSHLIPLFYHSFSYNNIDIAKLTRQLDKVED